MPGQPLSRVKSDAKFTAGAEIFNKHPDLMALAMQTIAAGAGIDYVLAYALTQFLHADPKTGMAMYVGLTGGEFCRSALMAAAKTQLPPDDFDLFDITLGWASPARQIRNDFAHHLWGYSGDIPDAALLIDQQCMIEFDISVRLVNLEKAKSSTVSLPLSYDMSLIRVYRKRDIQECLTIVTQASAHLVQMAVSLQLSDGKSLDEPARERLLSEPVIRQRYEKRKAL